MKFFTNTKQLILILSFIMAISIIANAVFLLNKNVSNSVQADSLAMDEQEATVRAIKKVMPAVVNIIVYDWENFESIDSPSGKKEIYKYKKQKSKGTGFLITNDGYILTNRHITDAVKKETGLYRVKLNSGKEYYAQMIGRDPLNDLAILKIFDKNLPTVELSDSDNLPIGTTVIAIGNALGRYQNSATKGIISGLGRSLTAVNPYGRAEDLSNVIQTDAEINHGNSGGPLIDLSGKVVGVNAAIDQGGSSIGFAIPIDDARPIIRSIQERGVISRPKLGARYLTITSEVASQNKLCRESGAWLTGSDGAPAIVPGSAADKAGLAEGDIIFEINAILINEENTLSQAIQKYKPGDRIGLKIQRGNEVMIKIVVLDEF